MQISRGIGRGVADGAALMQLIAEQPVPAVEQQQMELLDLAMPGDLLPDRHLALTVGGDCEGLQHLEVDLVGAVGIEQLGRGIAEAEALFDEALREAEARRDGGDGEAGIGQRRERHHLVGRVHGDADDILRC